MCVKTETDRLQDIYLQHLIRLFQTHKDKDLARMMGLKVSQGDLVRKMREGNATIHSCRMITLSQNLILFHNDTSLLEEMIPEGWLGFALKPNSTNGKIADEILNINVSLGKLIEEMQSKFPRPAIIAKYATEIATESATINEEVKK